MINREFFNSLSKTAQDELTDEPFSFRKCSRCQDYFDLGGSYNKRQEQAMYFHTEDLECNDKKIEDYQNKNNFNIDGNVFCWDCIKKITGDLNGIS